MGPNQFSDLTLEEFQALPIFGYKKPEQSLPKVGVHEYNGEELAASVDWRSKGAVTQVKDQGQCGSCWAFSATEEIESAVFMATKKLPVLSTQQIISCDKQDEGCNGGDTVTAYKFIEKNGGIDSGAD